MQDYEHDISLLEALFDHLPNSFPMNSSISHLEFELDAPSIELEGWGSECHLEIAWPPWGAQSDQ